MISGWIALFPGKLKDWNTAYVGDQIDFLLLCICDKLVSGKEARHVVILHAYCMEDRERKRLNFL